MHRPDLGCSDVQEKGEEEEQEQEQDPNHLAGRQVRLPEVSEMPQRRSPAVASLPRHALVKCDSPGSKAVWEM